MTSPSEKPFDRGAVFVSPLSGLTTTRFRRGTRGSRPWLQSFVPTGLYQGDGVAFVPRGRCCICPEGTVLTGRAAAQAATECSQGREPLDRSNLKHRRQPRQGRNSLCAEGKTETTSRCPRLSLTDRESHARKVQAPISLAMIAAACRISAFSLFVSGDDIASGGGSLGGDPWLQSTLEMISPAVRNCLLPAARSAISYSKSSGMSTPN